MGTSVTNLLVTENFNFDPSTRPYTPALTSDGQLIIGSTSTPNIKTGRITSPLGTLTIGYSSPNITVDLSGGGRAIDGLIPNSGTSPVVPDVSGNISLIGTGSITTVGSLNTETLQLTGLTNHALLVGAGTATITKLALGSSGQVLQSGGASSDPAYSTATFPSTGTATGTILRADGTNWVSTTATYPTTTTANQLVVSTAANVVGGLTAGTTGTVLTGVTGAVPAFSATPTVTSITFGSGTALSIFEQGTFSPNIRGSSVQGTIGSYSVQVGRYQKVGRIVTVNIAVAWGTIGTATGSAQIDNLPYTVVNTTGGNQSALAINAGSQATTTVASAVPFLTANINTTTANLNYYLGSTGANNAGVITATNGITSQLIYETT